mmetsp:Transcript_16232/g.49116  ORF Transcript_16232/g.49116 Transcript_16232/m.49116 type:complete len:109 (-) Transcript_16232:256-582(-)
MSLEERKLARAKRFNLPEAAGLEAQVKKKQRAERFGIATPEDAAVQDQVKKLQDEAKKVQRSERFKDPVAAADEARRLQRLERFKDPTVAANEAKLKARAERFKTATS